MEKKSRSKPQSARSYLDERCAMALIELQAARKINAMLREIREEAEAMAATDIDGPPRAKACA